MDRVGDAATENGQKRINELSFNSTARLWRRHPGILLFCSILGVQSRDKGVFMEAHGGTLKRVCGLHSHHNKANLA
jgi:hypothetical protein